MTVPERTHPAPQADGSMYFIASLLREVGIGRIALVGGDERWVAELHGHACDVRRFLSLDAFLALGEVEAFDSTVVDAASLHGLGCLQALFASVRRQVRRFLVLTAASFSAEDQAGAPGTWTAAVFAAGWRICPASTTFASLSRGVTACTIVFEKAECDADLNDPTRRLDAAALGHLERYAWVAGWVRPGDRVLDAHCGCGAGTALLAGRSAAGEVIGADADACTIARATRAYAERYGVRFVQPHEAGVRTGAAFDTLVCMLPAGTGITADSVEGWACIVRPDGRLLLGVDAATGLGDELLPLIAQHFLIEAHYVQPLGTGTPVELPIGESPPQQGHYLVVASANPLLRTGLPFRHPAFSDSHHACGPVADFGAHYDNPWLYRPLVQMGERIRQPALLRELALETLRSASLQGADYGAAATVLGYQLLAERQFAQLDDLCTLVRAYLEHSSPNPHVQRWQISLPFVAGKLCLYAGRREAAREFFRAVVAADPLQFSPLLATKTVAAYFWLGALAVTDQRPDDARECWQRGAAAGLRALQNAGAGAIGSIDRPLPFGFQELAEVADMSSQCATALTQLDRLAASPGRFWAAIDTRRFGLATWCLDLQRENEALRASLRAHEAGRRPGHAHTEESITGNALAAA